MKIRDFFLVCNFPMTSSVPVAFEEVESNAFKEKHVKRWCIDTAQTSALSKV